MFGRHAVRETTVMIANTTVRNARPAPSPGPSNSMPNTSGPRDAAVYPTPWENPESAAEPAWVRVRRLISVRQSGNVLGHTPSRQIHTHAAPGAQSRPANPAR